VEVEEIESAKVVLRTEKGTVDDLDTYFFVGTGEQDGLLKVTDFEAPASVIEGVVMPVPPDSQPGDEGTFTFDATGELLGALASQLEYFSVQARVDEKLAGGGFRRGLQVFTTATGNLELDKHPQLVIDTGFVAQPLLWTVTSLPTNGTLATLSGDPVPVGQTFTTQPTLLYTPSFGFSGPDTMSYQVAEGTVSDVGHLTILVDVLDECAYNGRPPGCYAH